MCKADEEKRVPIFGVVGASMSLLTAAVANLLRLFQIPLVRFVVRCYKIMTLERPDWNVKRRIKYKIKQLYE